MTNASEKREELLRFMDKKVFDPVLNAKQENYNGKDREKLEDIQRKTKNEKKQFHRDYSTASEVKNNYRSNLSSGAAKKVHKDLEHMGLPTMATEKDEFMELCEKLEV